MYNMSSFPVDILIQWICDLKKMKKTFKIFFPLIVLGFSTSIIQVIMLREFVSVFYSNEIIFGIILAFWMTLTGLGAWLGNNKIQSLYPKKTLFFMFLLLGLLPLLLVFLLNYLKHIFFQPGVLVGFWQLLPIIVVVLAPICLLSGNIFKIITKSTFQNNDSNSGSKMYSLESVGSIVGGLVVSLIMILWLHTMQSLAIVFIINLMVVVVCFSNRRLLFKISIILSGLAVLSFFFIYNVDLKVRQFLYPDQKIIVTHETPYGNLTFTESNTQINVFENLALLFTTENTITNEETAHFPMLQYSKPIKVLLIGGGISGVASQILKYSTVQKLVYVEPNPWLIHYALKHLKLPADNRLKVYYHDGRNFLANDSSKYNVIIIALPEPSTLQLNRYYTKEFVKILKLHSVSNAIISFSLNSSENYMNFENRMIHSVLYNTLKTSFSNVIVLPGEKDYFLASDNNLSSEISLLYSKRKIVNQYVNPGFIDDRSLEERSRSIQRNLIIHAPVNTDLKPIATSVQTALFFSQFKINNILLIVIVIVLLLIPVIKLNSISFCMYVTGLTASALEMLVLLVFQIMFGYLYAAAGIIFAIFMTGLAIGSWIGLPAGNELSKINILQLVMVILAFFIPLFLTVFVKINLNIITYPALFVLIFTPALVTGFQFSIILKKVGNEKPGFTGYLYGADLIGSAFGLLVVSTLLLPLLGMFLTATALAVINIVGIAVLRLSKQ